MSCPGRCGALCGYSSSGCGRPNHQGAQPNHHHHHSHFDRWGEEASYITPRALCGSGWGVPGGGSSGKLGAMQHYHRFLLLRDLISPRSIRVMAETYAADRDRSEREKERASGATGIPFSHATSVQGNPMRAGGWSSSSRYHRQCSREEAEWSDRVPSYWDSDKFWPTLLNPTYFNVDRSTRMAYSDDTLLHMFMMQIQLDQNRARLYVGHNCVFQKVFYKSLISRVLKNWRSLRNTFQSPLASSSVLRQMQTCNSK